MTANLLLVSTADSPMSACAMKGDVNGVRLWLIAGMDDPEKINSAEPTYENSALHWACYYGHDKVVEELLESKADPNQKNKVLRENRRGSTMVTLTIQLFRIRS
jgi:ankyrin repeat protein